MLHLDTKSSRQRASVIMLEGPAVDARTQITLGGAEVAVAGTWSPTRTERLAVSGGRLAISLAPYSAAIVRFL
jgi:hypothetical protein